MQAEGFEKDGYVHPLLPKHPQKWVYAMQCKELHTHHCLAILKKACKAAGIEGLRFHDIRRSVSKRLAINAGYSEAMACKALGHSSPSTTLKHYIPLSMEERREAFESLVYNSDEKIALSESCQTKRQEEKKPDVICLFSMN